MIITFLQPPVKVVPFYSQQEIFNVHQENKKTLRTNFYVRCKPSLKQSENFTCLNALTIITLHSWFPRTPFLKIVELYAFRG